MSKPLNGFSPGKLQLQGKNWELLMDPYPSLPCCAVCKAKEEDTKKLVSCESCLRVLFPFPLNK